jgi:type VII secretion-associated serine protease mycosin
MLRHPRPRRRSVWARLFAVVSLLSAGLLGVLIGPAVPASADSVRNAEGWVLNELNVQPAWSITQGKGVVVAVIDSGVNGSVSDLAGSVRQGTNFSGVDTPPSNPHWGVHGTWMASLIAGHGHGPGDGSGILGTAPQSTVLSIRVITDAGDPNYGVYQAQSSAKAQGELADAIRYAVSQGAEVISMSLGYNMQSAPVRAALQDAYDHSVVVVAAAGNSGTQAAANGQTHAPYSFPANYPGVLAVAAVNADGTPQTFSSQNLSVQVAAPGYYVPAQGRNGQYYLVTGTSPACALTAGVAALIKSKYPRLSDAAVISAITSTASSRPPGGYDDQIGFGIVNAADALTKAGQLERLHPAAAGELASSHFGRGTAATPPPVPARGPAGLILYCLLGVACLAVVAFATSRLLALRDRRRDGRPGPAQGGRPEAYARPAPPGRHAAPRGSPDDAPGPT